MACKETVETEEGKRKEVEGRWRRNTWPGEAVSSKRSDSWGIE